MTKLSQDVHLYNQIKMQNTNSNQQVPRPRRRQVQFYRPNDFFDDFDRANWQIITNYENDAQQLMIKSLAVIVSAIRKDAQNEKEAPESPKMQKKSQQNFMDSIQKHDRIFKKKLPLPFAKDTQDDKDDDNAKNPQQYVKQFVRFQKTGYKQPPNHDVKPFCAKDRSDQPNFNRVKKHDRLHKSMERLSLDDAKRFYDEIQQDSKNQFQVNKQPENFDNANFIEPTSEIMKFSNINDLLQISNSKNKKSQEQQVEPDLSDYSDYELTDYESNESSNEDHDYVEEYRYEDMYDDDGKPLFAPAFSKGGQALFQFNKNGLNNIFSQNSVQNPHKKLNFNQIMNSAKKSNSKQKRKRLYVNKKKIPRWAEDLKQVELDFGTPEQVHMRNQREGVFGFCLIQKIDTNIIFNRKDDYIRGSTSMWDKRKGGYVV